MHTGICELELTIIAFMVFRANSPTDAWRSILMYNKSTSAGTSLEGTTMFAQVTLHRTFNPLGSKCPWWQDEEAVSLRTITFLIIHRFLSLKVLLLSYLLFKKHCTQYISIWKIVLDLVKCTWHYSFMAGCGSLLWANTCSLWSGIKSWPRAGCLQRLGRCSWQ